MIGDRAPRVSHEDLRLPIEPDPEYNQTGVVSFEGLAGRALAIYLDQIAPPIRRGQTDEFGNDRLEAVVPTRDTDMIERATEAGFRVAEIFNGEIGLELIPSGHRTRAVRVGIGLEIIQDT